MQAELSIAPAAARVAIPLPARWLLARLLRAAAGFCAGGCLAVVLWSYWAQWGASLSVSCGLTLAAATAFISGLRAAQWSRGAGYSQALAWVGLAASIAAAPTVAGLTLSGLRWVPASAWRT